MKHHEGYLKSVESADIYYQYWLPEDDPRAILLLVHGLAEHSGRYLNVVNHLVPSGYAVYGMDHFGHGKSDGKRVYVERFEDYIKTLKIYFDMIRDWQPGKPIFLVGHSLGGLIGLTYLLEYQDEVSGAILSGPLIQIYRKVPSVLIWVINALSILMPKAGLIQLDAEGVSRDPAVVEAYVNDPLVYTGKITARLSAEFGKAMERVIKRAREINLPIMILQGSGDKLVDPVGAQLLYGLISSQDKTLKIYDGLYHEIFNEPEHEQVLNDVEKWLEDRP